MELFKVNLSVILFICYCLLPATAYSQADSTEQRKYPRIEIKKSTAPGNRLQLQVNNASLASVLNELSHVSAATIHYSFLIDESVTATCVADNLKGILNCLLGDKQNIVFQYSQDKGQENVPEDVWVLGSSLAHSDENKTRKNCSEQVNESALISEDLSSRKIDKGTVETLLLGLQTNNPKQKAEVISDLATKTAIENTEVDSVLLSALNDNSALVREQALFGWVYRKGQDATFELLQALKDPEMTVRMKAVDLAMDREVLTQAISDSSDLVRQLAQMKLDMLDQQLNN